MKRVNTSLSVANNSTPRNIRPYKAPNRSGSRVDPTTQVGKADESVCNDNAPEGNVVSQFDAENLGNQYDNEIDFAEILRLPEYSSKRNLEGMSGLIEKIRLGMSTVDCDRKVLLDDEPFPSREELLQLLIFNKNRVNNLNNVQIIPIDFYLSDNAKKLWEVIYDIRTCYVLSGFRVVWRPILLRSFITLVKELYQLDSEGKKWIKLVKFKLGYFAAFIKRNNVYPKSPFPTDFNFSSFILMDKKLTSYHRQLEKKNQFKHMILIDSICRGVKKGAPRPSYEDLTNNINDTFKLFTTPKVHEEILVQDLPSLKIKKENFDYNDMVNGFSLTNKFDFTKERLRLEILRTVREIFRSITEPLNLEHFPSSSASVGTPTSHGGGNREIFKILKRFYGPIDTSNIHIRKTTHTLWDYDYPSWATDEEKTKFPKEQEFIEVDFGAIPLMNDIEIEQLSQFGLTEEPDMVLMALAEALKTRGISKGPALENYLLKSIQKVLAKQLLDTKCFSPTKGDLTEDMINDMFSNCPNNQFFNNGDYDNATNEIYGDFSKFAISCIIDQTRITDYYPNLARLAKRSLLNNTVIVRGGKHYPDITGEQIDGQPMGKVLSFVTLCVINASMCRYVCELDQRRHINMSDFQAYINGDDCCFPLDDFDIWEQCLRCVGLKNSIGKTFYTCNMIEMNSRTFLRDNFQNNFKIVPFVNFGLLKCLQRSSESVDELSFSQFVSTCGPIHTEFVADFKSEDNNLYEALTDLFLKRHNKNLKDPRLTGISWFLPRWLTGLGLDVNKEEQLTTYDKIIGGRLYANYDSIKVSHYNKDPEWEIHSLVEKMYIDLCGAKNKIKYKNLVTYIPDHNDAEDDVFSYEIIDLQENQSNLYNKFIQLNFRNANAHEDIFVGESIIAGSAVQDNMKPGKSVKAIKSLEDLKVGTIVNVGTRQIKIKAPKINRAIKQNRNLLKKLATEIPLSEPLEYHKILHEKRTKFYPIIERKFKQFDDVESCHWSPLFVDENETK